MKNTMSRKREGCIVQKRTWGGEEEEEQIARQASIAQCIELSNPGRCFIEMEEAWVMFPSQHYRDVVIFALIEK